MDISVQLYSIRQHLTDDPTAALARLAEIGFTQVEPFALMDHVEMLREQLPMHGLTAPSTHASLVTSEDPARVFEAAASLGVRTVIDPYVDREKWNQVPDIKATADRLNELAGIAAEHGVNVGYHNHDFEARPIFEGRCGLEVLADHLDPRVVLELDTFWCAVGGTDPAELLGRLGQRVQLLHLKDGPFEGSTADQQPLGQGDMDVPSVLAAADWIQTGVIEFDDYSGDVLEAIARSYAQLGEFQRGGAR
ncbi:sugar phosphate isomerase/epimerase [Brachybacterium sp. Marseille-Q2903]|uniref:Sugar phosphate isomerase/epimerase n=1 Tax=Brachybacterium epidermidis TaxID=2781983 RepID=A0ABR9W382_9MICO|nr:sugar phosphate isomerase/epimerase [Brachybacterium epidermidis]